MADSTEDQLLAEAGSPRPGEPEAKGGPRRGEETVVWDDDHLFRDWGVTPPPTREGVEEQIRCLKEAAEFTAIVEHFVGPPEHHFVDIVQEEKLIGRSWGELTEGEKLGQLQVATDVMLLNPEETREILAREVDFTRVTPAEQEAYLGGSFDEFGKADSSSRRLPSPGDIAGRKDAPEPPSSERGPERER